MTKKPTFRIDDRRQIQPAMNRVWDMVVKGIEAGPVVVTLSRPNRTNEQNAKMWAMLTDVSEQVEWYGRKLSPEDWKHIFSASLKKQEAVPGIDGGFVVLGVSTSRMSKQQLSDLIEVIYAFGSEHNVEWSEP